MKEIVEYLKANPVQYLATVGLDGKAVSPISIYD